jgi:hypothetical protein
MPGHTQRLVKFSRLEKEAGKMLEENKSVPVSSTKAGSALNALG